MLQENSAPRFSRAALALLFFIVICAAAFRLVSLRQEALEGDEVFSRNVVLLSPGNEFVAIRNDLVHPPLYYYVLQATTKVWGTGANGVRALSLIFGLASVLLIACLGNILPRSRFTGILAAAVLALNQTHIFYSQEARSYAWYGFLVLLLVLWVWRITRTSDRRPTLFHWVLGALLMTAIAYTHYIGSLYVALAVLAILLSARQPGRRLPSFLCGLIAAISLMPWLISVAQVYKQKHGIGENLDWQGHPALYSLAQAFASSLGIPQIHYATLFVILVITILSGSVLYFESKRRSPVVVTLFLLAFVTPVAVFILSRPPFNLPLFGIRHLLPSLLCVMLLCCYGLDLIVQHIRSHATLAFAAGAVIVLALTALPTIHILKLAPTRIPYDQVSREVRTDRQAGLPAFTTWPYGIGEPVNFYCSSPCVAPLPADQRALPPQFVVLFRPVSTADETALHQLERQGYTSTVIHYYTTGDQATYGTDLALLKRSDSLPTQ